MNCMQGWIELNWVIALGLNAEMDWMDKEMWVYRIRLVGLVRGER